MKRIKNLTNLNIEIWAAASIAKAFDSLNLPYERTEKTSAPSFTKMFLTDHPHELPRLIMQARELNKLGLTVEVLSLVALVIIILIYSKFRTGGNLRKRLGNFLSRNRGNTGLKRTTRNKSPGYLPTGRVSSNKMVLGKYRKHIIKKTSTFTNKQRTWQELRDALRRLSD